MIAMNSMVWRLMAIVFALTCLTFHAQAVAQQRLGIFVLDIEKGVAEPFAEEPLAGHAYCGSPDWRHDGRRVVFDATPGNDFGKTHVFAGDIPADDAKAFTDLGRGNCPSWSPDGKHIAFLVNPGDANEKPGTWTMAADGTGRKRLSDQRGIVKWRPDGTQLLIVSFANPCELTLIDVADGSEREVAVADHVIYSVPSWAGDGQTLVAIVRGKDLPLSIALIDVGDPSQAKISKVLWKRGVGLSVEPRYPVFSPKTNQCLFAGTGPQGVAIYALDPDKPGSLGLVEAGRFEKKIASLDISPDGKRLLFCANRTADQQVPEEN